MNSREIALSHSSTKDVSLSTLCHIGGYLSIIASIIIWYFAQGDGTPEAIAHAERFGLFVGIWAPTFFILSIKYGDRR